MGRRKRRNPWCCPSDSSWSSAMTLGAELRVYLLTFKCLGLFCITLECDSGFRSYASRTDGKISLIGLLCSQCISLVALGHLAFRPGEYKLPLNGDVGNTYFLANYGLACLTIVLIHLYFYVRRSRLTSLVSLLLHHNRTDLENRHEGEFARVYAVYASQVLLSAFVQFNSFVDADVELWKKVVLSAISTYSYILIGLVVSFHYCLVRISASLMLLYNQDLSQLVDCNLVLSETLCVLRLRQRSRLLWVCSRRISSEFGLIIVLIMAFLLFSAPAAPFFLIIIAFEIDAGNIEMQILWHGLTTTLLWNLSIMVAILMTLRTDLVRKEANKTAKILAKVPRTGTGLDRMIEKFLLKNLRQQPILTAYGFFALDKSTLFKLFTAIFTYMVILVQFKEMEITTKTTNKF
ncbi:gustatory and pheromone receptor 39a isoform X1 [Drosophila gunungcola]|uniref:gustatory and pheromone receptor 39a isoform X1 n=1 Tax=Drosophila gunungcola TaxID=103775 RepID=UPI0022E68098|nr:gustatory and pheromone receptor 39a isoform X1 [Drosophila gunungcola]